MKNLSLPPDLPGSYALHGTLDHPITLRVGKLGEFDFPSGGYVYFGSAMGPGGVKARLEHHLRQTAHPTWHMDYLRPHLLLHGAWVMMGVRMECLWSQQLEKQLMVIVPSPGFGARDCRQGCSAHLFCLPFGLTDKEMAFLFPDPAAYYVF